MSVNGLYSWLKLNQNELAENFALTKTKLVIQADNLLLTIYHDMACMQPKSVDFRNDLYGGDLILYEYLVKKFFKNLAKCFVEPILVYDGSVPDKQVSLQAQLDVQLSTTEDIEGVIYNPEKQHTVNQLLRPTFRNVVNGLKLEQQVFVPYEAHFEMVKLANNHDCPILSNDPKLYLLPIKKGFVSMCERNCDQFFNLKGKSTIINCKLFSHARLRSLFPELPIETLPIMSVLLSKTIPGMDEVRNNLQLDGKLYTDKRLKVTGKPHQQINNLLVWLSGRKSLKQVKHDIINLKGLKNRPHLEKITKSILRSYKHGKDRASLESVLATTYPLRQEQALKETTNKNTSGKLSQPARFLVSSFKSGSIDHVTCLDIIAQKVHYKYRILDDMTLPSANVVIERPYRLALALLRPSVTSSYAFVYSDREYERSKKVSLSAVNQLPGYGSLARLDCYSMLEQSLEQHKRLITSCFNTHTSDMYKIRTLMSRIFIGEFLDEATICFMLVLKYIATETKVPPQKDFVQALLLTLVFYAHKNKRLDSEAFYGNSASTERVSFCLKQIECHTKIKNDREYPPKDHLIFRRIVHYITQLQLAYKGYLLINGLLQQPFTNNFVLYQPHPERFFNSTLIFRLTKMLMTGQLDIKNFQASPGLLNVQSELMTVLVKTNGPEKANTKKKVKPSLMSRLFSPCRDGDLSD